MHHILQQYLRNYIYISDMDFAVVATFFKHHKLGKREFLLREGEMSNRITFICKGCLRMYSVDEKGDEHIIQFGIENWWMGDRESAFSGKPSVYNIDALEDSDLLIASGDFMKMEAMPAAMIKFYEVLQNNNIVAAQKRMLSSISKSAEDKYLEFIHTQPDIAKRVPQKMIASYLGIKPETISRIRKRVAQR